jgi:hypothetical protein
MEWVLIIMMSTPGGDFIDKRVEFVRNKSECHARMATTPRIAPMGIRQTPICVTMDHWTGKKPMSGVALD